MNVDLNEPIVEVEVGGEMEKTPSSCDKTKCCKATFIIFLVFTILSFVLAVVHIIMGFALSFEWLKDWSLIIPVVIIAPIALLGGTIGFWFSYKSSSKTVEAA